MSSATTTCGAWQGKALDLEHSLALGLGMGRDDGWGSNASTLIHSEITAIDRRDDITITCRQDWMSHSRCCVVFSCSVLNASLHLSMMLKRLDSDGGPLFYVLSKRCGYLVQ